MASARKSAREKDCVLVLLTGRVLVSTSASVLAHSKETELGQPWVMSLDQVLVSV